MAPTNQEVAKVLEEIAVLLELSGENPFKARSYTTVARAIDHGDFDLATLAQEKRLREIKGVGDAIESKLEELVTTGKLEYHEALRSQFPKTLFDLFKIPGLGAKRIKQLYDELGIDSLASLEKAAREGVLAAQKGFGDKMAQKLLEGIAFARQHEGQYHLHVAMREAADLKAHLESHPSVVRIEIAGSLRRRKEVIKDIDIVASSTDAEALMTHFLGYTRVRTVTNHGETKSSVILEPGIAADLRVVTDEQFPSALNYFTGSKEHNVVMRQRAKERDLKLNEYGLFRKDLRVPCDDEAAIYNSLGLSYIEPELREDMGEFDAARLPALVERNDLKGLVHCHTTYSDGANSVEHMAQAALDRRYTYIVISDHSQSAGYAGGLPPDTVAKQHREIDGLNKKLKGIRILKGIESDIRADGSLDYDDDVLATFECVIASVHSKLDMTEKEATARLIKAIENPYTDILGHPSGRLLLSRQGFSFDTDKVFDACLRNKVAIEINANPHRLDLDWRLVRRGRDRGLKFSIGPDAHTADGMNDVLFGIAMARKGWLEPGAVINCMDLEGFVSWRKSS